MSSDLTYLNRQCDLTGSEREFIRGVFMDAYEAGLHKATSARSEELHAALIKFALTGRE